ncbi:hypothetical protein BKA69DRAFT_1128351 [Paraphysoderma sedebokerense]|nr:hypothetical protein BKA69DRAFT_1128351 [Paraphysoderma sedebokerense]
MLTALRGHVSQITTVNTEQWNVRKCPWINYVGKKKVRIISFKIAFSVSSLLIHQKNSVTIIEMNYGLIFGLLFLSTAAFAQTTQNPIETPIPPQEPVLPPKPVIPPDMEPCRSPCQYGMYSLNSTLRQLPECSSFFLKFQEYMNLIETSSADIFAIKEVVDCVCSSNAMLSYDSCVNCGTTYGYQRIPTKDPSEISKYENLTSNLQWRSTYFAMDSMVVSCKFYNVNDSTDDAAGEGFASFAQVAAGAAVAGAVAAGGATAVYSQAVGGIDPSAAVHSTPVTYIQNGWAPSMFDILRFFQFTYFTGVLAADLPSFYRSFTNAMSFSNIISPFTAFVNLGSSIVRGGAAVAATGGEFLGTLFQILLILLLLNLCLVLFTEVIIPQICKKEISAKWFAKLKETAIDFKGNFGLQRKRIHLQVYLFTYYYIVQVSSTEFLLASLGTSPIWVALPFALFMFAILGIALPVYLYRNISLVSPPQQLYDPKNDNAVLYGPLIKEFKPDTLTFLKINLAHIFFEGLAAGTFRGIHPIFQVTFVMINEGVFWYCMRRFVPYNDSVKGYFLEKVALLRTAVAFLVFLCVFDIGATAKAVFAGFAMAFQVIVQLILLALVGWKLLKLFKANKPDAKGTDQNEADSKIKDAEAGAAQIEKTAIAKATEVAMAGNTTMAAAALNSIDTFEAEDRAGKSEKTANANDGTNAPKAKDAINVPNTAIPTVTEGGTVKFENSANSADNTCDTNAAEAINRNPTNATDDAKAIDAANAEMESSVDS